jgi:hypothetical protein
MNAPFVDHALVQRIFAHGKAMARATARAAQTLGIAQDGHLDLGDAFAIFMGEGSPITQAYGRFGTANLEAIDRFYAGRASQWEAIVTPFDGPEAGQAIFDAGGRIKGWESTLVHSLDEVPSVALPPGGTLEVATGAEAGVWCETVLDGFMDGADAPPVLRAVVETAVATEGLRPYLARIDDEPAAGAALFVHGGVAFLGCASTRSRFRRRGLQSALIARRLRDARGEAELAWIGTDPGSGSQRNAERAGFRLAYTQLSFVVPTSAPEPLTVAAPGP